MLMKDLNVTITRNNDLTYMSEVVNQKLSNYSLKASSVIIANLYENQWDFEIRIIATGYVLSDFQIYISNEFLKIVGAKQSGKEPSLDLMGYKFSLHSFTRHFKLPPNIDLDKINTNFKQGILIIKLPKKEYLNKRDIS